MPVERNRPTDLDSAMMAATEGLESQITTNVTHASPNMRDLAALLALPRMWRDRDASFIVESLLDVIVSLLRSDVAYINLACGHDESTFEICRPADKLSAKDLGRAL